jgi:cell division protease FtsH
MIMYMGMSEKLPNLSYYDSTGQEYTFSKPYSDSTAELIDSEAKAMISEQYERAKSILLEHREGHQQLASILLEKEILFAEDLERIFGKRPWSSRSQEILQVNSVANKTKDNTPVGSKPQHLPTDDNTTIATPDQSETSEANDMGSESNTSEGGNIISETKEKQ